MEFYLIVTPHDIIRGIKLKAFLKMVKSKKKKKVFTQILNLDFRRSYCHWTNLLIDNAIIIETYVLFVLMVICVILQC